MTTKSDDVEMILTGVVQFGGKPHLTYTMLDEDFISIRSLVDQIGLDWRTQKKVLLDDENSFFYGTLLLEGTEIVQPPCKYMPKIGNIPSHDSENPLKIAVFCTADAPKDTLFIRLRRVQMYLARISISNVRGRGANENSAQYLLSLHEEWADALSDYETKGFAVKKNHNLSRADREKSYMRMLSAIRTKAKTEDAVDRHLLTLVIKEMADVNGFEYQADWVDNGAPME
jgi:hypothetical protein